MKFYDVEKIQKELSFDEAEAVQFKELIDDINERNKKSFFNALKKRQIVRMEMKYQQNKPVSTGGTFTEYEYNSHKIPTQTEIMEMKPEDLKMYICHSEIDENTISNMLTIQSRDIIKQKEPDMIYKVGKAFALCDCGGTHDMSQCRDVEIRQDIIYYNNNLYGSSKVELTETEKEQIIKELEEFQKDVTLNINHNGKTAQVDMSLYDELSVVYSLELKKKGIKAGYKVSYDSTRNMFKITENSDVYRYSKPDDTNAQEKNVVRVVTDYDYTKRGAIKEFLSIPENPIIGLTREDAENYIEKLNTQMQEMEQSEIGTKTFNIYGVQKSNNPDYTKVTNILSVNFKAKIREYEKTFDCENSPIEKFNTLKTTKTKAKKKDKDMELER